ncbi:MAG TPA: 50S ribosomal protein L13 [Candidatus Saccharimonadia bacterium]|nr:50S ribosomal protein L13 [Candidatus Saccharimonadia bacterium]
MNNPHTYMDVPSTVKREWLLMDAHDKILGDFAVEVAQKLMGKHKPTYTPHMDAGDYVVVINAAEVAVTGKKRTDKMYYNHSGFPGGLRTESFQNLMKRDPGQIITRAVKGMLPKNKLRDVRIARLKVFANAEHTYTDKFK